MADTSSPRETIKAAGAEQVQRTLVMQRILWMALLAGPLAFFLVIVFVIRPAGFPPQPELAALLLRVALGVLTLGLTTGVIVRRQIQRPDPDGSVDLQRYATGDIVFWALCEGTSLFGLVVMLLDGQFWPAAIIPGIASAAHLLTFPTGMNLGRNADTL